MSIVPHQHMCSSTDAEGQRPTIQAVSHYGSEKGLIFVEHILEARAPDIEPFFGMIAAWK